MQTVRTKLYLTSGSFSVLVDKDNVGTCFTDYTGTSRSGQCSRDEMIRFAEELLRELRAKDGPCPAQLSSASSFLGGSESTYDQ